EAVALAAENASGAGARVRFLRGDLLQPLPAQMQGRFDLIVSNPPYLEEGADLAPEVRADPPQALFGGPRVYARLFDQGPRWLRLGGAIVVEIEESSAGTGVDLVEGAGFHQARVTKDLNGRDRVVSALK